MAHDLSGKTAIVTGASSGLGAHFSRVLSTAGAKVIMTARREEVLQKLAADIPAGNGKLEILPLDVTGTDSIRSISQRLGDIDILVNNAGIARSGHALDQTEEDWDAVIDTNLKGLFLMAQAAGKAMRDHGRGGSIINIASILGVRQAGAVLPYAVSKAGAIQMTKALALELARYGIRVNALAPGYIDTDLNSEFWESKAGQAMINRIPQRRLGSLDDLTGPLLLLASDASAYMTGSVIAIDGGHLVSTL